jgi:glycosyltransferase involved in cell wall biosynthesis
LRTELRLTADDQLLVAVGNLYTVKGHRHLVAALAGLIEAHPRLHLAIAGRGPQEAALRKEIAALGLTERVHLLGLRHDVADVMAAADVFVLPSLSEGLPLAVLEAMSLSRPIVASGVGDVPRALANGAAGVLVPPSDVTALVHALDQVLRSEVLRSSLGRRAYLRWKEVYHRDRMVTRYARMLRALAARSGQHGTQRGTGTRRPAEHALHV